MKDVKDMFKFVNKRIMLLVFLLCIFYNVAIYGVSFALSHYVTSPLTVEKLQSLLICLVILYVLSIIFKWLFDHYSQNFLFKVEYDAKCFFYEKLLKMNAKNINKHHSGYIQSLIEKTSQDYAIIIETFLYNVLPLLIGLISFIYMAFSQSIIVALSCIIILGLAFIVRYRMQKNKKKYSKVLSEARSNYDGLLIDFIANIFTVIKLDASRFTKKKLDEKEKVLLGALQQNEDAAANMRTAFSFLTNLIYILIIVMSIFSLQSGNDPLPFLLFYISILGKVIGQLESCSKEIEHLFRFQVSKKQLDDMLGTLDLDETVRKWDSIKVVDGVFSYENRKQEIYLPDFEFNRGDKISIMGESGQGKTTILNVLSGLYDLNSGKIIIDDREVKDKRLDIVYISQEVELFDLSIRDNITLGKKISEEKILSLFEDAGLMEWYCNLDNGLEEIVGEKGVRLSAGQRQRLNIIRGILIDKDVYFFDEPTSNLDKESEEKIVNMIDKYLKDKTYIIVTHRDSIKRLCNKHYIFKDHTMIKE